MVLTWTIPSATDNSGMLPNVTVSPMVSPPIKLTAEEKVITYTAVDRDGNEATCTFTLRVVGRKISKRFIIFSVDVNLTSCLIRSILFISQYQLIANFGGRTRLLK